MPCVYAFIETSGIAELVKKRNKTRTIFYLKHTPELADWLEQSHEHYKIMFPAHMATTEMPLSWDGLDGGGYISDMVAKKSLVTFYRPDHIKHVKTEDYGQTSKAVNVAQRVAWRINQVVLETLTECWESNIKIKGLPERDPVAIPEKPVDDIEAYKKWKVLAGSIHKINKTSLSQRLRIAKVISIAQKYREYDKFYFPHHCDWRGRLYPTPVFLNPQSADEGKAMLEFSEGKRVSKEGAKALAIHGANCFGKTRLPLSERIKFVEDNQMDIKAVALDPLEHRYWTEADKPWAFLAFCLEWAGYLEEGEAFISHIPVAVDGSNNGLQIFSMLMRDEATAKVSNVYPNELPRDVYCDAADLVTEKLKDAMNKDQAVFKLG